MDSKRDGGPAFPVGEMGGIQPGLGLTVRDYFAAKAMQGLAVTSEEWSGTWEATATQIATTAYLIADAMLAARRDAA